MDTVPTNMNYYLEKLNEFISETIDTKLWESVLITEQLELRQNSETFIEKNKLWTPKECESRFCLIVTKGYGWVNMHACGVLNRKLIIDINWPTLQPEGAGVASVNLSRPEKWRQDRGCLLSGVARIENLT